MTAAWVGFWTWIKHMSHWKGVEIWFVNSSAGKTPLFSVDFCNNFVVIVVKVNWSALDKKLSFKILDLL